MAKQQDTAQQGKGGKKAKKDKKQKEPAKSSYVWSESASKARKEAQARSRENRLEALRATRQEASKVKRVKPPRLTDAEKRAKWGGLARVGDEEVLVREPVPEKNNSDRKWGLVDFAPPAFIDAAVELVEAAEAAPVKPTVHDLLNGKVPPGTSVHPVVVSQLDRALGQPGCGKKMMVVMSTNDPAKLDQAIKRSLAAKKAVATRKRKKAIRAATDETIALAKLKAKPGRKKKL